MATLGVTTNAGPPKQTRINLDADQACCIYHMSESRFQRTHKLVFDGLLVYVYMVFAKIQTPTALFIIALSQIAVRRIGIPQRPLYESHF